MTCNEYHINKCPVMESKKYSNFVTNPDVGIGRVYAKRLKAKGIKRVSQVLLRYQRKFNDKELLQWLKGNTSGQDFWLIHCCQAVKKWCNTFFFVVPPSSPTSWLCQYVDGCFHPSLTNMTRTHIFANNFSKL
ncbi:hypothetical protein MAR_023165 [Mya arenaria]|uniref:Uncharacterized protein n=1 Tax=Mya arenaria TaxID=6604 RepID=A0ABY7DPZ9_MYAAR|nr:hypothetical protein MAR_023165 [Mya arenaria]